MGKKEALMSLEQLGNALKRLGEALQKPLDSDNMNRDATIQRFEFTIELFWKTLKKLLFIEKITANSPRDVLQKAYAINWIYDENLWLRMMDDRNLTSHAYKEENAERIYQHIKEYFPELMNSYNILHDKFKGN